MTILKAVLKPRWCPEFRSRQRELRMLAEEMMREEQLEIIVDSPTTEDGEAKSEDVAAVQTRPSVLLTMLVFMAAIAVVRFVMPRLVEEVHYSIEKGRQRAQYEGASKRLGENPLAELSTASQLVHHRIAPSVVHIETSRALTSNELSQQKDSDGVADAESIVQGQGSGLILSESGQVITNYHVIQSAEKITVTFSDDQRREARVIGVDRRSDLALLQVEDAQGLIPGTWADSDDLAEGSMVWAVGSPFGLSKTITFGILSAKARQSFEHGQYHEFLQSDAAVSAGNSGGPLVDSNGDVVGINTAIIGPTYQGISFAIPSNRAKQIYEQVLSKEQVARQGWLGVRLGDADGDGALVTDLFEPELSPARKAGIEPGDVITKWDETAVDSREKLVSLVIRSAVNRPVNLTVKRQGKTSLNFKVTVAPRPLQF